MFKVEKSLFEKIVEFVADMKPALATGVSHFDGKCSSCSGYCGGACNVSCSGVCRDGCKGSGMRR